MTRISNDNLERLVGEFRNARKLVWRFEREEFSKDRLVTLSRAIAASLGLARGQKIHDHQRRVGRLVLSQMEKILTKKQKQIERTKNFEEIERLIWANRVPGFGELATYDVAHRLGIFLGRLPALVYLHAGTKAGAKSLGINGKAAKLEAFPIAIQKLTAAQAEDFLCVAKGYLGGRSLNLRKACGEIRRACQSGNPIC